ncbi:hypothetical protein J6590_048014 [Homalodisca vitripennis]|nr:hypothetical protein J6590_048014 [Homalodisca vitripennis]
MGMLEKVKDQRLVSNRPRRVVNKQSRRVPCRQKVDRVGNPPQSASSPDFPSGRDR